MNDDELTALHRRESAALHLLEYATRLGMPLSYEDLAKIRAAVEDIGALCLKVEQLEQRCQKLDEWKQGVMRGALYPIDSTFTVYQCHYCGARGFIDRISHGSNCPIRCDEIS